MSRQSAASRPFLTSSTRASIKPPADLSDAERAEFASAKNGFRRCMALHFRAVSRYRGLARKRNTDDDWWSTSQH